MDPKISVIMRFQFIASFWVKISFGKLASCESRVSERIIKNKNYLARNIDILMVQNHLIA